MTTADLTLVTPRLDDGAAMWRIAVDVGLDRNSPYKYLLFCRDFAATSVVARVDGEPVGFVTGYRRPAEPDTLFVWQVGVLASQRGRGVAGAMLDHLRHTNRVAEAAAPPIGQLEASVTRGNTASMWLFTAFADRHGVPVTRTVLFGRRCSPRITTTRCCSASARCEATRSQVGRRRISPRSQ